DVNGVPEIERLDHCGNVGCISVHVVSGRRLRGTAMPAAIMGDYPVAVAQEKHHLRVPVIGGERPAVLEKQRLTRAPVLIENFRTVRSRNDAHVMCSGLES